MPSLCDRMQSNSVQMYRDNGSVKNAHVFLVRASTLLIGRKDGCNRQFEDLIMDWLIAGWPIVIYAGYGIDFCKKVRETFFLEGVHGIRFPVCSCLVTPGEHNKDRIYTNTKDLRVPARCPKPQVAGRCGDDWNEKIYEAVIKRISRVYVPCKGHPPTVVITSNTDIQNPVTSCPRRQLPAKHL